MSEEKRYSPFSNGCQFVDWSNSNCCSCAKGHQDASPETQRCWERAVEDGPVAAGVCPIEYALSAASVDDGTVNEEVARSMGFLTDKGEEVDRYNWPCTEREVTEEFKEQWYMRIGKAVIGITERLNGRGYLIICDDPEGMSEVTVATPKAGMAAKNLPKALEKLLGHLIICDVDETPKVECEWSNRSRCAPPHVNRQCCMGDSSKREPF